MMNDRGREGYRGDLNRNCVTFAEVLKPAGYATYAAEKGVSLSGQMREEAEDLSLGEVEAATSSARMFANVAAIHKKKAMERIRRERARAKAAGSGKERS